MSGILRAAPFALAAFALATAPAAAESRVKVVKISVANATDEARSAENVVVRVADLKAVARDFTAGSFVVTTSDAATLDQDTATRAVQEVPSQADDLDGDGAADEIAFQIALGPKQTRVITVAFGPFETIGRVRASYPARTDAAFAKKYEGLGWESETAAWRLYFDARNAIDLFGKRRPGLQLGLFAGPDYDYHAESPYGRDIYKNGDAIGIGSVAGWHGGAVVKIADVQDRTWTVLARGPVRSIVEVKYAGWAIGDRRADVTSRITQWAGERGFEQRVTAAGTAPEIVTGLPMKPGVDATRERHADMETLLTWGPQVLAPGKDATASLPDQNLGLAVLVAGRVDAGVPEKDGVNHLQPIPLTRGVGRWYVLAAWDQEGSERMSGWGAREGHGTSMVLPAGGITTRAAFTSLVAAQARAMSAPAVVTLLSKQAAAQSAPASTLKPARSKTYREAIDLIRQEAERTATKWLPEVEREGNDITKEQGSGFFTEADNETGEWKAQKGYFWTGGFWVGTLWNLHQHTGDARFRRWAEAWNGKLLGKEHIQNHDVGFLNYYSSVLAFERTKDEKYKQAGLRAAERLKKLYNPQVELAAAWGEKGNDSIIDTMLNLQIWWWAADVTGDASWRELGRKHAQKTLQWFVRPDGSTHQSVHYNPGDNTQVFDGSQIVIHRANTAKPGEWVLKHTHQGWSADGSWSRGSAWAAYGFIRAYQETGEPSFLDAARRTTGFMLDRLPADGVPWYDFYDEGVMFRNRDTSAAAILAMSLLLLSDTVKDKVAAAEYRTQGRRIVQSLIDRYLTPVAAGDKTPPGILRHGCWTRPRDGGLIYGQYYLLEALLYLQSKR